MHEDAQTEGAAPHAHQRDPVWMLQREAERLLVEIAGPAPDALVMNPRYDPEQQQSKKYYTEHHPFTLQAAAAHLAGRKTYGARLAYPDGTTRASIYDTDAAVEWEAFQAGARQLQEAGFVPLLEPSPAGRGGHVILVYTARVHGSAAHRRISELAPCFAQAREYWPRPGNQRVRLPAGVYVRRGLRERCRLYDANGQVLADDAASAAQVLLSSLTPAELIPLSVPEPEPSAPPPPGAVQREVPRAAPVVDAHHRARYGTQTRLWVAFSERYLIERFNREHTFREFARPERNGMMLAIWRGERTASVGITHDGQRWTDFGAGARLPEGSQDGGDLFEFYLRISGRSKRAVLQEFGREVNQEASAELLRAARVGELPAAWVSELLTPEGRRVYNERAARFGHPSLDMHPGG